MRRGTQVVIGLGAVLALAGCGEGASPEGDGTDQAAVPEVTAPVQDSDGAEVGTVFLTSRGEGTEIRVEVQGLPPGFHGLHLHETGLCEPDSPNPQDPEVTGDFLSAGGHIGVGETDHGQHPGDLPPVLVEEAGAGLLVTRTDALTVDEILAGDGSALIVHSEPDNLAHIPDRYAPDGPDQDTLNTGDAGDRIACAALTERDS